MNKSYRSVFNDALGAWVATSEVCASRGKRSSGNRLCAMLLAAFALGGAMPALAADECGAAAAGSTVNCGPGTYGSGVSYSANDLTLNVNGATTVGTSTTPTPGVGVANVGSGAGVSTVNTSGIVSIVTSADYGYGIHAGAGGAGNAAVTTSAGTTVETRGGTGAKGVFAEANGGGNATATNNGTVRTNGATLSTDGSFGVYALTNAGGNADAINTGTVTTGGRFGYGTYAETRQGGTARAINSGAISTNGEYATGLGAKAYTSNTSATKGLALASNMFGGVIQTEGTPYGIGVFADAGGKADAIAFNDGTVSTKGETAQGVLARTLWNEGDATAGNMGSVTTSGLAAEGVMAEVGQGAVGNASAENFGTIKTAGERSTGIKAFIGTASSNSNATATMGGGSVEVRGQEAHGVFATTSGLGSAKASMTDGKVETQGEGGIGLYASITNASSQAASTVIMTGADSSVTTKGNYAYGLYANNSGFGLARVRMEAGNVSATGLDADGVRAESDAGQYAVDVLAGKVQGGSGAGAAIHTVSDVGGAVGIASGAVIDGTASGTAILDGDDINPTVPPIDGDAIVTTAGTIKGDAVLKAGNDTLNLVDGSFAGNIYGDGRVAGANDGDDTFNWSGGTLTGGIYGHNGSDTAVVSSTAYDGSNVLDGGDDVSTADGMVDRLTLQGVNATAGGAQLINWERIELDNANLNLAGDPLVVGAGNDSNGAPLGLHVRPTSSLLMRTSAFSITGDVHNAGVVDLRSPTNAPGNALTINGNYVGNNGLVKINTALGDDTSATDKLKVDGNTSGTTRLLVANAGGNGGATVNGIQVVQVTGTSSATDFSLAAPVQAGAYEYGLQRGGRTDGDANSFYLTSVYQEPPVKPVDPPPPLPPTAKPEIDPPPSPASTPEVAPQVLRPAVPGYVFGQAASLELGQGLLGTLHQREGEQQTLKWDYCGCDAKAPDDQAWVRLNAQRLDLDGARQFGFRQDMQYVQVGKDLVVDYSAEAGDESRTHTGISGGYGRTSVRFDDRRRGAAGMGYETGKMDGQMATLGAYHTRYADNGSYVDLVGQLHVVSNDYRDKFGGEGKQKGVGGGVSAEVGRPWQIGESQWLIEPQAQLSYQATHFRPFQDSVSLVNGLIAQSLRARLGGRLSWNDKAERGDQITRTNTFYLTANLLHEFKDQNVATVGATRITEQWGKQTWAEVGAGAQIPLTKAAYLYGGAQYQQSITGSSRKGVSGQVGVRVAW